MLLELENLDKSLKRITGFEVIDNGIGLDENNMKSFLESDSRYRSNLGGKGVGRFSWLKAFKKQRLKAFLKIMTESG